MRAVSVGLGARNLKDKDVFSKSDPFCVISRPSLSGGFNIIRVSETRQNTLNPDWKDFYFKEDEVSGNDMNLNLKIEIYDDDGKKGMDKKDKLLGEGFFSLKQLEAAALVKSNLNIYDGKRQKPAGALVVRTFKIHDAPANQGGAASAYPNQGQHFGAQAAGTVYPPQGSNYPPVGSGYPPAGSNYPPVGSGYPPSTGGYPPAGSGYPPAVSGYPPAGSVYPSAGSVYPQAGAGYPANPGYPPTQGGYPPAQGGYQPNPGYPGQPGSGFAMPGGLFPENNLPRGPGYM